MTAWGRQPLWRDRLSSPPGCPMTGHAPPWRSTTDIHLLPESATNPWPPPWREVPLCSIRART